MSFKIHLAKRAQRTGFWAVPVTKDLKGVRADVAKLARPRLRAKDFNAREGETLLLFPPRGLKLPERVLLIGAGDASSTRVWRKAGGAAAQKIADLRPKAPVCFAPKAMPARFAGAFLEGLFLGHWRMRVTNERRRRINLTVVATSAMTQAMFERARCVSEAILDARRLANAPASMINPDTIEEELRSYESLPGIRVEIWDEERLEEERMGCILAVGCGSERRPRLAIVRVNDPDPREATVLVGKGVCFDSGGYNLKSVSSTEKMYGDMTGVAVVMGLIRAIRLVRSRPPIIALLPLVENLISGSAYKPGDILTARNGLTIEVENTDAEGRLLHADALALASEWHPRRIVGLATLTGAAVDAVGDRFNALFTDDDELAADLLRAGDIADEPLWRLPLHPDYAKWIEGRRADLANSARHKKNATASTAIEFLRHFVTPGIPYAHIELSASLPKEPEPPLIEGNNAQGVRTLLELFRAAARR